MERGIFNAFILRAASIRTIYVAAPKACADQCENCARPNLNTVSGICGAHVGGLVGQRYDQIKSCTGMIALTTMQRATMRHICAIHLLVSRSLK